MKFASLSAELHQITAYFSPIYKGSILAIILFATIYNGRQSKICLARSMCKPLSWTSSAFGTFILLDIPHTASFRLPNVFGVSCAAVHKLSRFLGSSSTLAWVLTCQQDIFMVQFVFVTACSVLSLIYFVTSSTFQKFNVICFVNAAIRLQLPMDRIVRMVSGWHWCCCLQCRRTPSWEAHSALARHITNFLTSRKAKATGKSSDQVISCWFVISRDRCEVIWCPRRSTTHC